MNNSNTPAIIRSLIIYALCIPLAVWLGFMLADPFDKSTFNYFGVMALILISPILLRWHHFLLVATWNFAMMVFFLPGYPQLWLPMVCISLGLSIMHRTLTSKATFIPAPQITWPLIFLAVVVVFTAEMTGGFGMKALGSDAVGGKRYIYLLVAILGFFALTAQRIPPKRVGLYVALFFLAGCSNIVGDMATFMPYQSSFIFALFPASGFGVGNGGSGITETTRLGGVGTLGMTLFIFMLARYGIRGIFDFARPWRVFLFVLFFICMLFGGFRNLVILCLLIVAIHFVLERIHQTRLMPVLILAGIIVATLIIPFAGKLPFTFQRSLAFVPWLPITSEARMSADASEEWRLQIWREVYPQVPGYLLLGKGYYTSANDYNLNESATAFSGSMASDLSVASSGNYHSGPLSVAIFFGIWGIIGVIWFWIAGARVLYDNYRYGDPSFKTVNILLFAYFVAEIILFLFVFGSLFSDMFKFTGLLGLSVSLNGGVRRPAVAPVQAVSKTGDVPLARPRFQPFYQS